MTDGPVPLLRTAEFLDHHFKVQELGERSAQEPSAGPVSHSNGCWIRATPVSDKLPCRLHGTEACGFDSTTDSMYHPYQEGAAGTS
ncbi:hypothetical protein [Streptomyces triticisoli]|jgi:hypothetical protein|uniref:hypothetical protein n=1 Tax=Streptomyces triticisoli TaxID=2182797 RepID=UPI001E54F145|nr:hypothetical protein [Streptomyces triticisoli]